MSDLRYFVLGAGDHACVVGSIGGDKVRGFVDIFNNRVYLGAPSLKERVCGNLNWFNRRLSSLPEKPNAIVAFGNSTIRKRVFELYIKQVNFINVISDKSYIDRTVHLGIGNFVGTFAVINTDALVGNNCIINTAAVIEHHCCIGNNVNIAPGVKMAGNVTISDNSLIGVGATILEGVFVGKDAIIGAGANVIRDVNAGDTVVGNPAKSLK